MFILAIFLKVLWPRLLQFFASINSRLVCFREFYLYYDLLICERGRRREMSTRAINKFNFSFHTFFDEKKKLFESLFFPPLRPWKMWRKFTHLLYFLQLRLNSKSPLQIDIWLEQRIRRSKALIFYSYWGLIREKCLLWDKYIFQAWKGRILEVEKKQSPFCTIQYDFNHWWQDEIIVVNALFGSPFQSRKNDYDIAETLQRFSLRKVAKYSPFLLLWRAINCFHLSSSFSAPNIERG